MGRCGLRCCHRPVPCETGVTILSEFHHDAHDPRHEPVRSELAVTATAALSNTFWEMRHQIRLAQYWRMAS